MAGINAIIEEMIEERLLTMNNAYIAKVISFDSSKNTAKIQPLAMYKQYGITAKIQSILNNVPVIKSARYKIKEENRICGKDVFNHYLRTEKRTHLIAEPISSGDVVLCIVCDRELGKSLNGQTYLPALGHHQMSNSIVVGVF